MIAFIGLRKQIPSIFLLMYLLSISVIGVLQLLFTSTQLFLGVNQLVSASTDLVFLLITWLGSGWAYAAVCLAVLIFQKKYFWLFVSSFALTSGVAQFIKYLLSDCARPFEVMTAQKIQFKFPSFAEELHWNSFPSGHTISAFSMFFLLSVFLRKSYFAAVCFILALLVALSRVYLVAHFVRDVYWGMIIGVEVTSFTLLIFKKYNPSFINQSS